MRTLNPKYLVFIIAPALGALIAFSIDTVSEKSKINKSINNSPAVIPLEAVAALGKLSPSGKVRRLAAPITGFGGTPRVAKLLINEGDLVQTGQILAIFDNRPQIKANITKVHARIKRLQREITMQKKEVSRYRETVLEGASSLVLFEEKQDELFSFEGQKEEAMADLIRLQADLRDSELKSPIDGIVLRIKSRVGERPGTEGVLEVGSNQFMEALIEVYESDIKRVQIGQSVVLVSENGGFSGSLKGKVKSISPQVRQREVLSTDPTGDADARVVEVAVALEPDSAALVSHLTGMKVIARFKD